MDCARFVETSRHNNDRGSHCGAEMPIGQPGPFIGVERILMRNPEDGPATGMRAGWRRG